MMKTKQMLLLLLLALGVLFGLEAQAFYNSSTGRWLNRVPIGTKGGLNSSGFLRNSPVDRFDRPYVAAGRRLGYPLKLVTTN